MNLEEEVPQKPFYTIGEVSRITGVEPHILRYWEGQGKLLKPRRLKSRRRLYQLADIQLIFEIKRLRNEEKLTLAAMRRQMNARRGGRDLPPPRPLPPPLTPQQQIRALLRTLKEELLALRDLLD